MARQTFVQGPCQNVPQGGGTRQHPQLADLQGFPQRGAEWHNYNEQIKITMYAGV